MQLPKILFTIIVSLALIFLGYFVYVSFFKSAPPSTTQTPSIVKRPKTAGAPKPRLNVATQRAAIDYWQNAQTNSIYYISTDGRVIKTFGDGREQVASEQALPNFHSTIPNHSGTMAIGIFEYPINPVFAVFDTGTNNWERLPANTIAAAFSPDSTQIAYLKSGPPTGSGSMFILNIADRKSTEVARLNIAEGNLRWVKPQLLYLETPPSSTEDTATWEIRLSVKVVAKPAATSATSTQPAINPKNITGVELRRLSDMTPITMTNYASNADVGLGLVKKDVVTDELYLTNGAGIRLTRLPFLTLPSKCAFANELVYCAVPVKFPPRVDLPDDYLTERFYSIDVFLAYDMNYGALRFLAEDNKILLDAEQLSVRGKELLFRNRYDGKLYSLEIK